jgi:hypothetical protein
VSGEDQPTQPRISGSGMIALAIVAGAFILAWGGGDDEPRYQLASSDSAVYRMDTDSGEIIACTERGCARVQQPDRAATLGPIGFRVNGGSKDAEQKALPAPESDKAEQ